MATELTVETDEAGLPLEQPSEVTVDILRHSAAHLMAAAVCQLFPGAQYDVGPAIEDGFFYNFRLPDGAHFSDQDLESIEAAMKKLATKKIPYEREIMDRSVARELFTQMKQPFKVDIIDRLPQDVDKVGIYRTGDFVDLCRGPHVPDSGWLKAVKLMHVAGVYWRGDEKNEQLQRLYGTAWLTQEELDGYLHHIEEAKRRDHRKLGVELDLFSFPEEIGSGLAVFHPKGGLIRKLMEDYSRQRHEEAGYEFVNTPHITKAELFETSGHLEWYAEGMFPPMDLDEGTQYYLKPMNCPFHNLIFRARQRSYRELPLRLFEFGAVYRYEKSGVVHGLTRVRGLTMDDAHIYCSREQMGAELTTLLDFVLDLLRDYGLSDFYLELSTKPPEKSIGSDEEWDEAIEALRAAARTKELDLVMDEGGGAFYGPKISVQARDAIGRTWQLSTIQLDFHEPRLFGLEYIDADGSRRQPVMIHRALFGSVERFFAILLEHYAGAFPLWLAPVQCEVVPVQDDNNEVVRACASLLADLKGAGIRAEINEKPGERMQARIRDAEQRKVPYVVVIGKRDVERGDGVVTIRDTRSGEQSSHGLAELIATLKQEAGRRRLES